MKHIYKIALAILATIPLKTYAHVKYIASQSETIQYGGFNFQTLLSPLTNPKNIIILAIGASILYLIFFQLPRLILIKSISHRANRRLASYRIYIPWILRLSLGILLIGAGLHQNLLTPALPIPTHTIATLQTILGFSLLIGIFQKLSTTTIIALYIYALTNNIYTIGSLEILAMSISLLIFPTTKPSLDNILGIDKKLSLNITRKTATKITQTLTRLALGTSFAFLAIYEKFLNPDLSSLVVTKTHLQNVINISPEMWTLSAGLTELTLGILLLLNKKPRIVAIIAIIVLSLSFFYFKEDVTSHITIFGALSIVFILGNSKHH